MLKNVFPESNFIGSFLAASPFLLDEEFMKSVVLITNSDAKGTSGFKINHVLQGPRPNLLNMPSLNDFQVYNGGPIAKKSANLLHSPDIQWDKTKQITPEICVTNIEKNNINLDNVILPKFYFLTFGFTSWNKEQLEEEIKSGYWLPTNSHADLLFSVPVVNRWYTAYQSTMTSPDCVSMDTGCC